MANSKISALTSATTPLAGTETLPIVQSSATKQVSVANLTAGRSVSAADYVMSTGNLVPSTAAKGVNFTANTPVAGMTSQLLNWYEHGTFTPTVLGSTTAGTGVYSLQKGFYTRIGNLVTIKVGLAWSAHTGTGNLLFGGLPFNVPNDGVDAAMTIGYVGNLTLTALNVLTLIARINTATVAAYQYPTGGGAATTVPIDTAVTLIEFSGTYNI
jgi:hypothetical protein